VVRFSYDHVHCILYVDNAGAAVCLQEGGSKFTA
jgi:hypothetical protein